MCADIHYGQEHQSSTHGPDTEVQDQSLHRSHRACNTRPVSVEGYRHPLALIGEDDDNQRALLSRLLEESEMEVLECDSAEAAVSVLDRIGERVWFLFTDEDLAGTMSGAALAANAKDRFGRTAGEFKC